MTTINPKPPKPREQRKKAPALGKTLSAGKKSVGYFYIYEDASVDGWRAWFRAAVAHPLGGEL